jgi:ankyrin repeat protein
VRNARQALPALRLLAPYILSNVPKQATELADTVSKHLLALAAMSKDEQIIKLLLENGPDLSANKNIDNDNDPLKIAIDNAAAECAQILFSHLPNTAPAGFTPLMSAIHASLADLALLFLKSEHSGPSHLTNQGQFALRRMTGAPTPNGGSL